MEVSIRTKGFLILLHTISRIRFREEIKVAVKVFHIVILQNIASYAEVEKSGTRKDCRKEHDECK